MIVLGLDTATNSTAVALRTGDGETLRARDDPAPGEHPGHATRLLELADRLLAEAGLAWGDIERIAVGTGPGRFTGLRVGISSARALAQSLGTELVGISSLRALALAASEADGEQRPVIAVIDARRGEAFAGAYWASADFSSEQSADSRGEGEVAFLRPLPADAMASIVEAIEREGAAPGQRWLAVGDGALHFREQLERAGAEVAPEDSPLHRVDGGAVCALGNCAVAPESYESVVPDYRRSPDAAIARVAAGGSAAA
jgi:tRNA threonylcarbamoyladenosine biosynthesis protein TsaB